jgi:hypothetical protein
MPPPSRWSCDTWCTLATKVLLPSQMEASWLIVMSTLTLHHCMARTWCQQIQCQVTPWICHHSWQSTSCLEIPTHSRDLPEHHLHWI